MPFDVLALYAVADELRTTVQEGRVQRLHLVDEHTLALEVYAHRARHWLLASADPEAARVHLSADAPLRGSDRVTPLLLLLRKHVRGARLASIVQPPLERILELRFAHLDERGLLREVSLVLELMGRRSNFVLVDEDATVLDALRRVSARVNPSRPLVPHGHYVAPPAGDRLDPRLAGSYFALEEVAAATRGSGTIAQLLVAHLAGLSPFAAEEIAYRATGVHRASAEAPWPAIALHAAATDVFAPVDTHEWAPHWLLRDAALADVVPYLPRHVAPESLRPAPSISAALERLFALGGTSAFPTAEPEPRPRPATAGAWERLRVPLHSALGDRRVTLERKRAALERSLEGAQRADALRSAGEAILANLGSVDSGAAGLVFEGQEIALDPERSPLENAQAYFEDYTRARDAGRIVPDLIAETDLDLAYIGEVAAQVELADSPAALEQIRRELVAQGLLKPNRGETKRGRTAPPRGGHQRVHLEGFDVLVGTSALGNERVTFELSSPDDVWLHARGVPGSHVIVRSGGRALPISVVEEAARLAARHSAARDTALVLVDWTAVKHVRKIRGAPPGLVRYAQEQTLRVRPDE